MEKVILLHGILLHEYMMTSLAKYLKRNGYEVINISYPSRRYPLKDLAQIVQSKITTEFDSEQKIHLVGYSMGGLIWRSILVNIQPINLGRLVMIGTPNQGSEVADTLHLNPFVRFLFGPAISDLRTTSKSAIPALSHSELEFGIISGNKPCLPLFNGYFTAESDGQVSVDSSHLQGAKDHLVLPFDHTFAPFNKEVQQQTLHFIKNGTFQG